MKVVERTFVREVKSSAAVVKWNYWDQEHFTQVHSNYTEAQFLYESDSLVIFIFTWRLPILSFITSSGLGAMVATDEYTFKDFQTTLFGIPSFTTIKITEKDKDNCVVATTYRFILRGWRKMLGPIMYRMMATWNERVWLEDLPLKLRRHKVLRWGFRDFVGFPDRVDERVNEETFEQTLPVPRPKGCAVDAYASLIAECDE